MSDEVVLDWRRWGMWRAHLYIDGVQQCNAKHHNFEAGKTTEQKTLVGPDIGPTGIPYGPVCAWCITKFEKIRRKSWATSSSSTSPRSVPAAGSTHTLSESKESSPTPSSKSSCVSDVPPVGTPSSSGDLVVTRAQVTALRKEVDDILDHLLDETAKPDIDTRAKGMAHIALGVGAIRKILKEIENAAGQGKEESPPPVSEAVRGDEAQREQGDTGSAEGPPPAEEVRDSSSETGEQAGGT